MSRLWYRDTIVYAVDVGTFHDGDGDGIGDFTGLRRRLDHIDALGVGCVWLLPFFPSGGADNGYDITDYYDVDSRYGGLGDAIRFIHEARDRGIRVVIDLVVNHTSAQHPWFRRARSDAGSRYRDYYLWRDEPPAGGTEKVVFRGSSQSAWTYDEEAGQHYLHHFYREEPDLNTGNPGVQDEILKIAEFWMQQGVAGFRVDAAPYIVEKAAGSPGDPDGHAFLRRLRDAIRERRGVLLAEADVEPRQYDEYFGQGDEVQLLFQFLLNNFLFLALVDRDAGPLVRALAALPEPPATGQWVNWVRNFDELDLERLSRPERERVFAAFAPDEDMRAYGRGIRRMLAPMVGGNSARQRLAQVLAFSLPGTPMIRQGEEIGMGDDLSLPERDAVRTPMQWSDDDNGGFSSVSDPARLVRPVIRDGPFGYRRVNVADQEVDPDAHLQFVQRLVRARKRAGPIGSGQWRRLDAVPSEVLALRHEGRDEVVVTLANLGDQRAQVPMAECDDLAHATEVLANRAYERWKPGSEELGLDPSGFRWIVARR